MDLTTEQLNDRLERARAAERKALLKSLGFDSEEQARAATAAAEAARLATLSTEQRLREENTALTARATAAETARATAEFEAQMLRLCSERGITDHAYARYLVTAAAPKDGTAFDAGAYLDEQLKNERTKVALGVGGPPPPPTVVTTPITTLPNLRQIQLPAPPPPPGPQLPQPINAMTMSHAEFQAHKAKNGI